MERIENSDLDEVVVTNTIPLQQRCETVQENLGAQRGQAAGSGRAVDPRRDIGSVFIYLRVWKGKSYGRNCSQCESRERIAERMLPGGCGGKVWFPASSMAEKARHVAVAVDPKALQKVCVRKPAATRF